MNMKGSKATNTESRVSMLVFHRSWTIKTYTHGMDRIHERYIRSSLAGAVMDPCQQSCCVPHMHDL